MGPRRPAYNFHCHLSEFCWQEGHPAIMVSESSNLHDDRYKPGTHQFVFNIGEEQMICSRHGGPGVLLPVSVPLFTSH